MRNKITEYKIQIDNALKNHEKMVQENKQSYIESLKYLGVFSQMSEYNLKYLIADIKEFESVYKEELLDILKGLKKLKRDAANGLFRFSKKCGNKKVFKRVNDYKQDLADASDVQKLIDYVNEIIKNENNKRITVDLNLVDKLSNENKAKYYEFICGLILFAPINKAVTLKLNHPYIIDESYKDLFKTCYKEYKKAIKLSQVEKCKMKRVKACKKATLKASLAAAMMMFLFNSQVSADAPKAARREVSQSLKIELDTNRLQNSQIMENINLVDRVPENAYQVVVTQDVPFKGSAFDTIATNECVFSDSFLTGLSHNVEEIEFDNGIRLGFHLTFNNPVYYITETEFKKVYSVVNHECNKSYEDALTVISIILNRMEDPRFDVESLLDVVSAEGQFEVWDENEAASYANMDLTELNENVCQAMIDAIYFGVRNNDYVEFKASWSSDYTETGELKVQLSASGNKCHNIARTLGRVEKGLN